jgi:peptidoglycan/LPS O-acetylase OafA/YrhL
LGVQLFFVLSGFLITMLAIREESKNGCLSISSFYIRRSFRIFPLYFLVLALYCALILVAGFGGEVDKARFISALPYYLFYINEFAPGAPFYQSWSLGIEEKFYLLWPFVAFVLIRNDCRKRFLVTIAVIAFCFFVHKIVPTVHLSDYGAILVGCTVAIALENKRSFEKLRVLGSGCYPWGLIFLLLINQLVVAPLPATAYLYPFVAGLWLASSVIASPAFLSWKPLTYFGARAYGIYLVHILCIRVTKLGFPSSTTSWWVCFFGFVIAAALSLFIAECLYRLVESPCIQVGRKLAQNKAVQNSPPILEACVEAEK